MHFLDEMFSLVITLPDCSVLTHVEGWPSLQKLNLNLPRLILGLYPKVVVTGDFLIYHRII